MALSDFEELLKGRSINADSQVGQVAEQLDRSLTLGFAWFDPSAMDGDSGILSRQSGEKPLLAPVELEVTGLRTFADVIAEPDQLSRADQLRRDPHPIDLCRVDSGSRLDPVIPVVSVDEQDGPVWHWETKTPAPGARALGGYCLPP
jgi:hypothetical protein